MQDGCRNKCTFCIVTVARGEERSRSIPEIVAEIRGLHEEGYQEAVLTGVHLGGYGADLGTGLAELTSAVLARHADPAAAAVVAGAVRPAAGLLRPVGRVPAAA